MDATTDLGAMRRRQCRTAAGSSPATGSISNVLKHNRLTTKDQRRTPKVVQKSQGDRSLTG